MPGLVQSLITAQVAGAALNTSTSATSLLPAQAKLTFPTNYFGDKGRPLRIRAQGKLSNIVTTPGTLTMDIRLGGTVVFNGGAMQMSMTAHTDVPWWWDVDLTLREVGAAANFMGASRFVCQAVSVSGADPTTGHSILMAPNTAPAVGTNFDATALQQLDLFGKFSVSDAANSITLEQYEVFSLY
jgi:hypothetical protein